MRPNVLFLVIDSFRADKCYGSKKTSVTPNLDYLIQNGIYFSQMISSAPASIPAVSSILTGLFPFKSLSLENDVYNLKKDIPNIIGILKNSGYETIATIPNILKLMNLNHIFNEINSYDDQSTLYDGIGEKILEKFDNLINNEPWVYYLHLNDIHGQAIFHKDFFHDDFNDVKLGKNQYERMVSLMDPWIGKILKRVNLSNTLIILTADHGSDVASFDSEMEKISKSAKEKLVIEKNFSIKTGQKITSKLPKFFNPLRRNLSKKYRAKRTSIVEKQISPVLDKIESEEQDPYKKRLLKNMLKASTLPFDEKFRIPLIFSGYGVDSHHITSQQIRSVDIFPTILELLKFENNYFDFGIITGVIEILENDVLDFFLDEVCRTISNGMYIEDLFEKFPGGIPRDNIDKLLEKRGVHMKERYVILSEPFDVDKLQDPMKLWPIMLDQNIWAEK